MKTGSESAERDHIVFHRQSGLVTVPSNVLLPLLVTDFWSDCEAFQLYSSLAGTWTAKTVENGPFNGQDDLQSPFQPQPFCISDSPSLI